MGKACGQGIHLSRLPVAVWQPSAKQGMDAAGSISLITPIAWFCLYLQTHSHDSARLHGTDTAMSEVRSLSALNESDYIAIEGAVMETARGRWFLAEYAKRNRHADTETLLTAMARLEQVVGGDRPAQQIEHIQADLMDMAESIARLKIEVASSGGSDQSRFMEATEVLDAVVRTTESATSSILESAEQIQEAAWTLRECGAEPNLCDKLDRRAAEIYTACTFQDLTAQRTQKVVRTLRFLEGRINALIDTWGPDGPRASTSVMSPEDLSVLHERQAVPLSQSDIDVVIVEHAPALIEFEPLPDQAAHQDDKRQHVHDRRLDAYEQTRSADLKPDSHDELDVAFIDEPACEASLKGPCDKQMSVDDDVIMSELDALSNGEKLKLFN